MPDNDYHFVDRWRVEADVKEVADIIEDAFSLPETRAHSATAATIIRSSNS